MSKNFVVLVVIILAAAAVSGRTFIVKKYQKAQSHESAALQVNESNFNAEIEQHKGVVLIDFWADWCGPCRMLGPIVEELIPEYKGKMLVAKVDVDQSGKLAQRFEVSGIPLLMIMKDGKVVDKRVGVQTKPQLKAWIDGILLKN